MDSEQVTKKQKIDDTENAPMEAQRMALTNGGLADTQGRTSETAVSIPPTITYGLQETHTTVLPAICWFSCPNLALNYTPTTFTFSLNSIYGIMDGAIKEATTQNACWIKKLGETNYANGITVGYPFPSELANDSWAGMYPWWRDTWEKFYMYYTVLGVEYEIVISQPGISGRKSLVAYTVQTSGSNANTSVSLPTNVPLRELYGMKNIQFKEIAGRDSAEDGKSNIQIIKGTYKPGTALRDISNDGDVKLWSKTDETGAAGESPTYKEYMQVMSYNHPMYTYGNSTNGIQGSGENIFSGNGHNVQVRLKYIVQFKQLRASIRFPLNGLATTQTLQYPAAANPYFPAP